MSFRTGFLLALLLMVLAWSGQAQTLFADKPLGEIEESMEANLTWNLQNALLVYYPETKFVVNAKVDLAKVEPKKALPKLPDALLTRDLTNLPGLPYLPAALENSPEQSQDDLNLQAYARKGNYQVQRILVNVLVDRSLSQSDWSFIRRFVTLSANLEPTRGDQVRIEGLTFPEKASFFSDESEKKPEPLMPPPFSQPKQEQAAFDWLPYLFAGGLAIFLLLLFLVGQRNLAKYLRQPPAATADLNANAGSPTEYRGLREKAATDESERLAELQALKSSAIDALVGTPAAAAKIFNGWIEADGDAGVTDVALVLSNASRPLVNLLEPYLGQENTATVKKAMATMQPDEIAQGASAALGRFERDIRKLMLSDKDANETDALSFLHQMSDDQLQHLLKPLKTGVVAIVVAQLRANRAAKIIERMDSREKKAVLAAMGNIERIPSDVYQHIARQLAGRAQELKKMRYVRANGVDALVKVLDYMDDKTQSETLDYLQSQDLALSQKVSKQFMTFEQLVSSSSERLREVALETDRDTFARSLVTLDEKTVTDIIERLPERLAEMVRASMEMHQNVSEEEVAEARRNVIRAVRSKKA